MRIRLLLAMGLTVVLGFLVFWGSSWAAAPAGQPVSILSVDAALTWLRAQQRSDGGFGDFGSAAGVSADVVLAAVAGVQDPATWVYSGTTVGLLDYLGGQADTYSAKDASSAGKLALAVIATHRDPHNFAGLDLIARLQGYYSSTLGVFGPPYDNVNTFHQTYSLMALKAAAEPLPTAAVDKLREIQKADGGWGYSESADSDTNSTALALQALVAAGESIGSNLVVSATGYLTGVQNTDGGFPYQHSDPPPWPGANDSDCSSTALVIQALVAIGQDPQGDLWTTHGPGPLEKLMSFQSASGAFTFYGSDNVYSTKDAIPALMGKTIPMVAKGLVFRFLPIVRKSS